jgi:hypothetical protein
MSCRVENRKRLLVMPEASDEGASGRMFSPMISVLIKVLIKFCCAVVAKVFKFRCALPSVVPLLMLLSVELDADLDALSFRLLDQRLMVMLDVTRDGMNRSPAAVFAGLTRFGGGRSGVQLF